MRPLSPQSEDPERRNELDSHYRAGFLFGVLMGTVFSCLIITFVQCFQRVSS